MAPRPAPMSPFLPILHKGGSSCSGAKPIQNESSIFLCLIHYSWPSACDHPSGQEYSCSTCHVAGHPVGTGADLTCRPQTVRWCDQYWVRDSRNMLWEQLGPHISYHPCCLFAFKKESCHLVMSLPQIPPVTPSPGFMSDWFLPSTVLSPCASSSPPQPAQARECLFRALGTFVQK